MYRLNTLLKTCLRRDGAEFTRHMFQQARQEGDSSLHNLIRAVLKTGRRFKAPQLSPCLNVDGKVVEHPREVKLELGRFFSLAEQGQEVEFSAVVGRAADVGQREAVDIDGFPTVAQVAHAFADMKGRRAAGLSGLPADVYKACPVTAAHLHMPLYLKVLARGQAPTLWRGCLVTTVPKPGKPQNHLSGHRSIALQEPAFKALTKAMRGSLETALALGAPPGLSGGRRGRPLSVTSMTVQTHVGRLRKLQRSGAVLFLDGVSAFYSVSRRFLLSVSGQADVQSWIDSMPVRASLKEKLVALLWGPTQLERLRVAISIQDTLVSAFAATWFTTLTDHGRVFQTFAGTVPGSPVADILFQIIMIVAADEILARLEDEGLRVVLNTRLSALEGQDAQAPLPTWLDDIAILLEAPDAASLQSVVGRATRIAYEAMQMIGVKLNFQCGKTEAILHFAGPGSKAARHALLLEQSSLIPIELEHETLQLRCVPSYLHLGTTANFDGHHLDDVRRRKHLAEATFAPLYRRLLYNPWLSDIEKTRLVQTLVLNKFCHGSGLWRLDTKAAWHAFNAGYMSFVKRTIRPVTGLSCKFLNDDQACALVGVLSPSDALHHARVRQLWQMAASSDAFLWGSAIQAKSWLDAASVSLLRVIAVTGEGRVNPLPHEDKERLIWFRSVEACQVDAKALLRQFRKNCIAESRCLKQEARTKADTLRRLDELGAVVLYVPDVEEERLRCKEQCEQCGALFKDPRAKAAHKSKKHGIVAKASTVACGSACQACGKEFWSNKRLKDHLRRAVRCLHVYVEADVTCDAGDANSVSDAACVKLPAAPLVGPKPWWACLNPPELSDGATVPCKRHDLAFRINCVKTHDQIVGVLQWWHAEIKRLSIASVQAELEGVSLDALSGPRLITLKFASFVACAEYSDEVFIKGNIYISRAAKDSMQIHELLPSL